MTGEDLKDRYKIYIAPIAHGFRRFQSRVKAVQYLVRLLVRRFGGLLVECSPRMLSMTSSS